MVERLVLPEGRPDAAQNPVGHAAGPPFEPSQDNRICGRRIAWTCVGMTTIRGVDRTGALPHHLEGHSRQHKRLADLAAKWGRWDRRSVCVVCHVAML